MVSPATLPPEQRHSSRVPGSLLRERIPTEIQALAVSLGKKQGRFQEKQISQLRAWPIPAAGASWALILQGSPRLGCWEGTVRPSYTLLCDRRCQKIKEIKPGGSSAVPPARTRQPLCGGAQDTKVVVSRRIFKGPCLPWPPSPAACQHCVRAALPGLLRFIFFPVAQLSRGKHCKHLCLHGPIASPRTPSAASQPCCAQPFPIGKLSSSSFSLII